VPRRGSALGWLKHVSSETTELFERMAQTSERATDRSSEVLFGVVGGAAALMAAYTLSLAVPAAAFFVGGPIAAVFGIPAGILSWRGRRRFKIEKRIAENRIASDEVLERIKALPRNAPASVRESLWTLYNALNAELALQIPDQPDETLPPLLLPHHKPQAALPHRKDGRAPESTEDE
jgi:hypothetical protein